MKIMEKGTMLVVIGIAGAIFVSTFDIIAGKSKNMIGPKSIIAFIVCALIRGIISLFNKRKTFARIYFCGII